MKMFVQALKEHTGCTHKLSLTATKRLRHGNEWWRGELALLMEVWSKPNPAYGSAVFHDAARWLMALPGHIDHPLFISDEEFASFVGGAYTLD